MVQGVSGKKWFLVRFQYGYKNYLTSNQLTIMIEDTGGGGTRVAHDYWDTWGASYVGEGKLSWRLCYYTF